MTPSFAKGETAKTVSVPVLDDAVDEGKEVMRPCSRRGSPDSGPRRGSI